MSALNALVSEAVDVVVHLERGPDGVEVTSVIAVEDQAGGPDSLQFTATDVFTRTRRGEAMRWTGQFPVRAGHRLEDAGYDMNDLLGDARLAAGLGGET